MKSRFLFQFFVWTGRRIYSFREWLEKVQNWADAIADRHDRDNFPLTK